MSPCLIELKNITKDYPGVRALDSVTFGIEKASVHGIIGENGAGKSTLIKIISGAIQKDAGEIIFDGQRTEITGSRAAIELGIGTVYQEMNLVPTLNAVENIFLGVEQVRGLQLDRRKMKEQTEAALQKLGISINLSVPVKELSVAQQQMVEIARSLVFRRRLIIMDEPTSSLTAKDVSELFRIIRLLKEQEVTIIFISHKLDELMEICDQITVMRDGRYIDTVTPEETNIEHIVKLMVGREMDASQKFIPRRGDGPVVLEVEHLCDGKGMVKNVSFQLHKGVILGFAGLIGAGRTELMRLIFGADPIRSGTLRVKGKEVTKHSTENAVKMGIAYLSEDRKNEGLVLKQSLTKNISLANMDRICHGSVIDMQKEITQTREMGERVRIKTPDYDRLALFLSGGNQQKLSIAKWLFSDCDILIFDEPTRGIDVQARAEIYSIINDLVDNGKSIILVSSDLNEILSMSNTIITMCDGKITGTLNNTSSLTQAQVMKQMLGE